eukprot:3180681-Prymnesium_polylepis.1
MGGVESPQHTCVKPALGVGHHQILVMVHPWHCRAGNGKGRAGRARQSTDTVAALCGLGWHWWAIGCNRR